MRARRDPRAPVMRRRPQLGMDLSRSDRELLAAIGESLETASRMAGSWLACRRGCTECCIGPFPINRLDAWRLRRGLAELSERDPERAAAVSDRARRAVEEMKAEFPGDAQAGTLNGDRETEDRFFAKHAGLPCPALDPATGACELYEHRPISCRTYGPPVRIGTESLPPCRLCFQGAAPHALERCRVSPDPDGLESAILERIDPDAADHGESVIAFALRFEPEERRSKLDD